MKKAPWLLLCLGFSGAICAEQTDSCVGLEGPALNQCRSNQQTLRLQQRLEQQLQQQQERQIQLDKQQREMQEQLQNMRLQNEDLRKELERQAASQPARLATADSSKAADIPTAAEIRSWKADNPWYGSDYAKTQFAVRYIKQLQQQRPDLTGRQLLDALSTKVDATFAAKH
jgi:TolA-binding protein